MNRAGIYPASGNGNIPCSLLRLVILNGALTAAAYHIISQIILGQISQEMREPAPTRSTSVHCSSGRIRVTKFPGMWGVGQGNSFFRNAVSREITDGIPPYCT